MSESMADTAVVAEPLQVPPAPSAPAVQSAAASMLEADLLVEDVSIDGMCGVY